MTFQHQQRAERDANVVELHDPARMNVDEASFGTRLRQAREARRLDLESCAHVLKLPARVLRHLENDEREGMDYAIYLGSYITKYAHHLGLDEDTIQAELCSIKRAPPALVVTGGISHSRYMLERYATAATYVVLTAVMVVPMIWLGVRGTLDRDIGHLAALDAQPVAQQASAVPGEAGDAAKPIQPAAPAAADQHPLMASMAPFPEMDAKRPAPAVAPVAAPAPPVAPAQTPPDGHSLTLSIGSPSWVEVVAGDGTRLAYGLLPAGTSKTWRSDQPLEVRIGNATDATASVDGQSLPLADYRHANVAHFKVRIQDGKAVPVAL